MPPPRKHDTVLLSRSVMGGFSFASLVAPVVAPTLAGFLIDLTGGWRPVFAVLLGLGVLILVLGLVFVRNVTPVTKETFRAVPVLLSSVGFCGFLIGISSLSCQPRSERMRSPLCSRIFNDNPPAPAAGTQPRPPLPLWQSFLFSGTL